MGCRAFVIISVFQSSVDLAVATSPPHFAPQRLLSDWRTPISISSRHPYLQGDGPCAACGAVRLPAGFEILEVSGP